MSKQCGYCRLVGHDVRGCQIKNGQIETIRRFVGREREALLNLFIDNGLGVGAIIEVDAWNGKKTCVVTSHLDTLPDSYLNRSMDWKLHRYRKSIRSILYTYTGNFGTWEYNHDDYVRVTPERRISIMCRPLHDMAQQLYAGFSVGSLPKPPPNMGSDSPSAWWGSNTGTILSPSGDTDLTRDDLRKEFYMHERLSRSSDRSDRKGYIYTPIFA